MKVNFLLNTFHPPSSGGKHVHSCLPYTKKRFTSRVILVRLADEEYKNLKEIYRAALVEIQYWRTFYWRTTPWWIETSRFWSHYSLLRLQRGLPLPANCAGYIWDVWIGACCGLECDSPAPPIPSPNVSNAAQSLKTCWNNTLIAKKFGDPDWSPYGIKISLSSQIFAKFWDEVCSMTSMLTYDD